MLVVSNLLSWTISFPILIGLISCLEPSNNEKNVPLYVQKEENQTVMLPCLTDNVDVNVVNWWKNEILIATSADNYSNNLDNIKIYSNYSLEVSNMQQRDNGLYICQIIRDKPWGPIVYHFYLETIVPISIQKKPDVDHIDIHMNQEITLECIATGLPTPIIKWYFNEKEMPLIVNRNYIRFTITRREMEGLYTCVAFNNISESVSKIFNLRLLRSPNITASEEKVYWSPNYPYYTLLCNVDAYPSANITWMFNNNKAINIPSRDSDNSTSLYLKASNLQLGIYSCIAKNNLGISKADIILTGEPKIAKFKSKENDSSDNAYMLHWEVECETTIYEYKLRFREYQFYRKTNDWIEFTIPPSSHSPLYFETYTLQGLTTAAVYEAFISSRNSYGWSENSEIFRFCTKGAVEHPLKEEIIPERVTNVKNYIDEQMKKTETVYLGNNWHEYMNGSTSTYDNLSLLNIILLYILYIFNF